MRIPCYLVTPLPPVPYSFKPNPRHLYSVRFSGKNPQTRAMSTTLVKSLKKKSEGRSAVLNRQSSVQTTAKIPVLKNQPVSSIYMTINMPTTQFEDVEIHCRNMDENDQIPKYQNSYRLEPYKPFNAESVDKIVKQVMTNNLEDIVYDPKECPKLCTEISADIRNRIRKHNFDRYKIVVIVTINEKASQAIQTSMRFIWDVQRDNYSSFTFETRTFFAYCCVFGVYCE